MRVHGDDHLHLVLEAVREERANRTVDQARDQRLLLGRTAFALEIAARNLAGGIGLFLIVHGEGEEVLAWLGARRSNDGGKHRGLAILRQNGGGGLTGHAPGFQFQRAAGPVDFFPMYFEHSYIPIFLSSAGLRRNVHFDRYKRE